MPTNEMTISTEPELILGRVNGSQMDEEQSQAMVEGLLAAAEQAPSLPVVLDLSNVSTMPSMSIGALMTLWKRLQEGQHRLLLTGAQAPVRNTLAVCRLDKFFEFCENEEEARLRLRQSSSR